jgi:hypothetical protein
MDRLILEDFRCFQGRHEVPLAPLTILMGESGTGKSTLLAAVRLAWDLALGKQEPGFNEEPFPLGSYGQIATWHGLPDAAPPRPFSLGSHWRGGDPQGEIVFHGTFSAQKGQPFSMHWWMEGSGYRVERLSDWITVKTPSTTISEGPYDEWLTDPDGVILEWLLARQELTGPLSEEDVKAIENLFHTPGEMGARPYAFSPDRSWLRRTYDPYREIHDCHGSHVPMVLANLAFSSGTSWNSLRRALEEFGIRSGLYKGIEVCWLGRGASGPFQLELVMDGALINLVDAGYGVRQILPVLVECLLDRTARTFLLQQPEAYLHPRAQAELGSFFVSLAKQERKRFLIETHSDSLVDRIRMDLRDGKSGLQPEDVALLYFERGENGAQIHRLEALRA